jgi:hypothetical protein
MPSEGNGRPLLRDGRPLQRCSIAKLSCKGVKIFCQDGSGKTFSTSLEFGRNKSWAETTCYKSDTCPFVPFGIECASQDRANPWPTGVPLDGSKGALPFRPSPPPPGVSLRRFAYVARPAGFAGVQDRPPACEDADAADGDMRANEKHLRRHQGEIGDVL